MRRRSPLPALVLATLGLGLPATAGLLWLRSRPVEEAPVLASPEQRDIVRKTVATGAVRPRDEVAIKPRVSGVVSVLHVEPGDLVEAGDPIADIKVIPNSGQLAAAQAQVQEATLALQEAERLRDESAALGAQGAASAAELRTAEDRVALARQRRDAARTDLAIVRDGASRAAGDVSTQVRATVSGMVLTVPVKLGASVIEANTFNEGTTVAELANMQDIVFLGMIDEAEVGGVNEGMPLQVRVAAWPDLKLDGVLEHISPKGVDVAGAVQFELRARVDLSGALDRFVRAGMSANADIVLERRDGVLAISEALLAPGKEPAVEVKVGDGFERRPVQLGLSDGIWVEVQGGIGPGDVLRRPTGPG
jgi:HlyD family secretion protein